MRACFIYVQQYGVPRIIETNIRVEILHSKALNSKPWENFQSQKYVTIMFLLIQCSNPAIKKSKWAPGRLLFLTHEQPSGAGSAINRRVKTTSCIKVYLRIRICYWGVGVILISILSCKSYLPSFFNNQRNNRSEETVSLTNNRCARWKVLHPCNERVPCMFDS